MSSVKESEVSNILPSMKLLTVGEVKSILRCGTQSIYNYMARKKDPIPSVKIGKNRRFQLEKVLWWIENQPS